MGRILELPELDNPEFERLRELCRRRVGITLADTKRAMVRRRLLPRLKARKVASFREYVELLEADPREITDCLNALSTNLPSFYREPHHFDFLRRELSEGRLSTALSENNSLRIWSAGCATGEEAYSIAITVGEAVGIPDMFRAHILATDINTEAVETAIRGEYELEAVTHLPRLLLKRWFRKGVGVNAGKVKVRPVLQEIIEFKAHNLLGPWLWNVPFEVVFCRNVMIYFEKAVQRSLLERFWQVLVPGGLLFLGHAETVSGLSDRFRSVGRTVFEKVVGGMEQ